MKLGGFRQQKFIFSQFLRPEIQNPCVHRAKFPLNTLEDNPCYSLPNFWGLPAVVGVHWFVDTLLQSLLLSSHGLLLPVCLCLCSKCPSSYEEIGHIWFRGHPEPMWLYLDSITSARILFLNKVIFMDSTWTWILGGHVNPAHKTLKGHTWNSCTGDQGDCAIGTQDTYYTRSLSKDWET